MANNINVTEGVGTPVAADEVGGIKYQRIKLTDGTEDSTTPVNTGAGVATNAMRTTLASDDPAVVALGVKTTSVTALEAGGVGIIGWLSQIWRDLKSGIVLAAGTNAIGKLSANSGVDIGDVDVTSLPTLATVTTVTTVATLTGGGVVSGATDSGNPVKVGGRYNSTPPTFTNGQRGDLQLDASGNVMIKVAAGGAASGTAGTPSVDVISVQVPTANVIGYAAPAGGLVTTTAVSAIAAAGSGVRNFISSVQVQNTHATIGTEIEIQDGNGGTVLWRGYAGPLGGGIAANLDPPRKSTANTAIYIKEVTTTATAGVLVNLQGFTGA